MSKTKKVFYNQIIDKRALKQIMACAFKDFGSLKASYLANKLKDIGFKYSTKAGLSLSIEDLKVPPIKKNLIKSANKRVEEAQLEVKRGEITEVERFQKVIKTWNMTSNTLKDQVASYFKKTDPLNSIYMIAFSGARGNISQVRQLVGMRGLMADPNGQIINLPILTNFREGLTITDYIISSYGARKGLVDTALRTADSGYLTRRLIDVAQDMITREKDCKTKHGVILTSIIDGNSVLISLKERIIGRVLAFTLKDLDTDKIIAYSNQEITPLIAKKIEDSKITRVTVRSPLTCSSSRSICQQCYGWNLAYGKLIDLGEAVGIIAAQSIGEPGTQLTMRTFHTGGVFTAESSRQIRAKLSGKIVFSKTLKTRSTRTQYGEMASISESEGIVNLITYNNSIIKLEILPKTLILVKNNSFVCQNDILFELTSKINKAGGEKAFKYIYANESGEIYFEEPKLSKPIFKHKLQLKNPVNCLVWIFFGQVFNVSSNSKLKVKTNLTVDKNSILTESKLVSLNGGKINFSSKNELNVLQSSNIIKNSNVYIENDLNGNQDCVIYGSTNRRLILKTINSLNPIKDKKIGDLINITYRTKTGGTFYSSDFNQQKENRSTRKKKIKISGGTVFYLPESSYQISKNANSSHFSIKNGDYVKANSKIHAEIITNISGTVYFIKDKRLIKEVIIRPGHNYRLEKRKQKSVEFYSNQLAYPGEILFETIKIKQLSFTEITTVNEKVFLNIVPVVRYEISNVSNELDFFLVNSNENLKDIKTGEFEVKFQTEKKIKSSQPLQIISSPILNELITISNNYLITFNLNKIQEKTDNLKLTIIYKEILNITNVMPDELKNENISINLLAQNFQYLEPYSNLNSYQTLVPKKTKILKIKNQILSSEKKILLISNNDYQTIYLEQINFNYEKNQLVKLDKKEKHNYIFKTSGLITQKIGNSIILKKGSPYLFSQGARIDKRSGDLIKQGEKLGQLTYQQARTEDIVQGLPRVEEILEARKPKLEANLAIRPGIISNIISTSSGLHIWVSPNNSVKFQKDFYKINYSQRLVVGLFEFINVGQPLHDAPINAHTILDIYFSYFKSLKLFSSYSSAYRSFRKIQAIFLNSVQAVYYSQGVIISDKHVEIIIKQMTGKVQIVSSGHSPLLPDELVELKQVHYINNSLDKENAALFKPVILGITKASLKTTSFISAASFQHTTKILTEAAIQGRSDWLRGLKENVIVGRLIPAGTGFNRYSDISYMKVKIPSLLNSDKKDVSSIPSNFHLKYKNLKDRIKFKFLEES